MARGAMTKEDQRIWMRLMDKHGSGIYQSWPGGAAEYVAWKDAWLMERAENIKHDARRDVRELQTGGY